MGLGWEGLGTYMYIIYRHFYEKNNIVQYKSYNHMLTAPRALEGTIQVRDTRVTSPELHHNSMQSCLVPAHSMVRGPLTISMSKALLPLKYVPDAKWCHLFVH